MEHRLAQPDLQLPAEMTLPPPTATAAATFPRNCEVAAQLQEAWLAGGPAGEVLARTGRSAETGAYWQREGRFNQAIDLDGDGSAEWILSLAVNTSRNGSCGYNSSTGELWIVNGTGLVLALQQTHDFPWGLELPLQITTPDLTGDGLPELLVMSLFCGAHTATGTFHLIIGHGGIIRSAFLAPDMTEPLGATWRLVGGGSAAAYWNMFGSALTTPEFGFADFNEDGLPDLYLSGGTFGFASVILAMLMWSRRMRHPSLPPLKKLIRI